MATMSQSPQPLAVVHRAGTRKECRALALVLDAVDIRYEILAEAGGFALVVADLDETRARAELDAYVQENRDWPAKPPAVPLQAAGWGGVCGYIAVLLIVDLLVQREAFGFDWFSAGKTRAGLIRQGEMWRAVTALTLHSDLPHLAANVLIGGLIGLFAGQMLGSGLAWGSIMFGGTLGNVLNAWIRSAGHSSVGASTAVFAALGIVAAYSWKRRRHPGISRLQRWAPLVGGVVLLGFLGTGGERTDVAAHVTGFLSGLALGAVYGTLGNRLILSARTQFLLGAGAVGVLALAWVLALR
jgi:membrane associated rhomboid family serine protease